MSVDCSALWQVGYLCLRHTLTYLLTYLLKKGKSGFQASALCYTLPSCSAHFNMTLSRGWATLVKWCMKWLLTAGHGQSVTCANWSHSGKHVITSSDDKTANVWSLGSLDPVLTFSTTIHNITSDTSDKVSNVAVRRLVRSSRSI